jgi:hypothetical protein
MMRETTNCLMLEDVNALIEGGLAETKRGRLADHVIACPDCARKFRAMRELAREFENLPATLEDAEPAPKQGRLIPFPLRYALGVAAVMIMAVSPYLTRPSDSEAAGGEANWANATAEQQARMADHIGERLGVLHQIATVNRREKVDLWGQDPTTTVRDLID